MLSVLFAQAEEKAKKKKKKSYCYMMKVTAEQGKRPHYSTTGWPSLTTGVISSPSNLFLPLITRKQASQFKTIPTLSQTGPSPLLHKPLTGLAVQNITRLSSSSSASSVMRVYLSFHFQPSHIPVYPPLPSRPLTGAVPQP